MMTLNARYAATLLVTLSWRQRALDARIVAPGMPLLTVLIRFGIPYVARRWAL